MIILIYFLTTLLIKIKLGTHLSEREVQSCSKSEGGGGKGKSEWKTSSSITGGGVGGGGSGLDALLITGAEGKMSDVGCIELECSAAADGSDGIGGDKAGGDTVGGEGTDEVGEVIGGITVELECANLRDEEYCWNDVDLKCGFLGGLSGTQSSNDIDGPTTIGPNKSDEVSVGDGSVLGFLTCVGLPPFMCLLPCLRNGLVGSSCMCLRCGLIGNSDDDRLELLL